MTHISRENILVIYNPAAGAGSIRKLNDIIDIVRAKGIKVTMSETRYAGHAQEIANQSKNQTYDLIVAAGGDGTMNEVVNGIYPNKIPIAIIPLGTVNVLALEMGLKNTVPSIADYIINGNAKPCWLGRSNDRYFLLMVSAGYDAKAVANVSGSLKAAIGKLAYMFSFVKTLIISRPSIYDVEIEGKKYICFNVIVSNGRLYGGNFMSAPEASLDKNHLVISMAQKGGRLNALKYALCMFLGKYPKLKSVQNITATNCYISCSDAPEPIQLDGDAIGELPSQISVSDEYLMLLRPNSVSR